MACKRCDFNGFIETERFVSAGRYPVIAQCPTCKDIEAYSRRVQQVLNNVDTGIPPLSKNRVTLPKDSFDSKVNRLIANPTIKAFPHDLVKPAQRREEPCRILPLKRS